ncbi:lysosomal Pro-X carboxypeptidase [Gossypium australe]|uniref:Lysosomal Pro-X carboxypeptidase n=1 Tax=Gossypium australe TaxID=47621 RepID=A0A5B6UML6_9ROSI|nr:lysosomal Pro-X carboxypeptidase [Gossypium australe]
MIFAMDSLVEWLLFLVVFLSISISSSSAGRIGIPRGAAVLKKHHLPLKRAFSGDLHTYFYTQTLDHFNYKPESYATFQQRYVINYKYWGGGAVSAPIFVCLGAEQALETDLQTIGFLDDNAARFNALILYIEHRYYGESVPFGSREEAFRNAYRMGYLNSAQALADYAEIIADIKNNLQASHSPVIVIGASYGGMLASWFRLKYPHLALGALASSAPVLYFDNITPSDAFYSIITKSFRVLIRNERELLPNYTKIMVCNRFICFSTLGSFCPQLQIQNLLVCPLNSASELKKELESIYVEASQFNQPAYLVNRVCAAIDETQTDDILFKIFAAVVAFNGNNRCYINPPTPESQTVTGWKWQTCSEMVIPIGVGENTMFQPNPFDLNTFINDCIRTYSVAPRPHWITSYYGGNDFNFILQKFGSNIIFSNGLRDPFSAGGVLEHISKSIRAVTTTYGSHCLDLLPKSDNDPEWLTKQRNIELRIIKGWLVTYYADLKAFQKG